MNDADRTQQKAGRGSHRYLSSSAAAAASMTMDVEGGQMRPPRSRLTRPDRSQSRRPMVASETTRPYQNFARLNSNLSSFHHPLPAPPATDMSRSRPLPQQQQQLTPAASFFQQGATHAPPLPAKGPSALNKRRPWNPWRLFVGCSTFLIPSFLLRCCGRMKDPRMQFAWREKLALNIIIYSLCVFLAYFTFGLQKNVCSSRADLRAPLNKPPGDGWAIRGDWYFIDIDTLQRDHPRGETQFAIDQVRMKSKVYEASPLFANSFPNVACAKAGIDADLVNPRCNVTETVGYCHSMPYEQLAQYSMGYAVSFDWEDIADSSKQLLVFNGAVLDMQYLLRTNSTEFGELTLQLVQSNLGRDVTRQLIAQRTTRLAAECLKERYTIGYINKQSSGCFAGLMINLVTLVIVVGLILTRLMMAILYSWVVAPRLSRPPVGIPYLPPGELEKLKTPSASAAAAALHSSSFMSRSRFTVNSRSSVPALTDKDIMHLNAQSPHSKHDILYAKPPSPMDGILKTYSVVLVTCYSEGEEGLRTTLESIAEATYPDDQKLIFLVADGLVTGGGNEKSTPDICKGLMTLLADSTAPPPLSYIAVADGSKQHNMAQIYAGYFEHGGHAVPTILVVKCGTPAEADQPKPGNRGKRDSQIILMNFFSKVMFDDRLTPMEFDLYRKIKKVSGVTPDHYETVLMVDADTKLMPSSLGLMINAMCNDPTIMGLCGETRIANKHTSWITGIQVYEYFISHHFAKNFESLFGGVTCLPGCFSMYRLKAPKGNKGTWVPILTSPDIVEEYSQNVVETLHQKNLLLLGEDRFLTTLMLRTFPKRHMIFLPQAVCKTVVPDEFKVLLSQRRRWINSTVHNLMELVLVKDLCGTFCFSMQFVVAMELFGTVVLPASLIFTFTLIGFMFSPKKQFVNDSLLQLLTLVVILFVPPIIIVLSTRRFNYVGWMLFYMAALPVWNFVLPVYAFWHFDDFSWGKTRLVEGESGKDHHGNKEGTFDPNLIPMRRLVEWEKEYVRYSERYARTASRRELPPSPPLGDRTSSKPSSTRQAKPKLQVAPDRSLPPPPPPPASKEIDPTPLAMFTPRPSKRSRKSHGLTSSVPRRISVHYEEAMGSEHPPVARSPPASPPSRYDSFDLSHERHTRPRTTSTRAHPVQYEPQHRQLPMEQQRPERYPRRKTYDHERRY